MTDEQLNKLAETYLKLKPFIRRAGQKLVWDPATEDIFTPTFEQFLTIEARRVEAEVRRMPSELMDKIVMGIGDVIENLCGPQNTEHQI